MKSIKEKAIEHNKKKNFVAVGDVPNEDFEAGANYVLDVIQKFVIENHFNLEHIIKQLKSN